jgi:hypothetical protein
MSQEKVKDTKLGAWLKDRAPSLFDKVGNLLPDKGVLGVIKRLVDTDPDISAADKL